MSSTRWVRVVAVLWPAFLGSIVLEGLVFTAFDPLSLRWTDALGDPLPPLAVYTLGFLIIWAAVSGAVALSRSFPEPRAADDSQPHAA